MDLEQKLDKNPILRFLSSLLENWKEIQLKLHKVFSFTAERFVDTRRSQAAWITEIDKIEFNNSKSIKYYS